MIMTFRNGTSMARHVMLVTIAVLFTFNFTRLEGFSILSSNPVSGRHQVETYHVSEASRELDDDTVRVDPLDGFKRYRGGFDITNKHYWTSTAFTGIYGYSIAAIWLLSGVGYGVFVLVTSCMERGKLKKRPTCHKQCYLHHLLVAIFLTLLAITACGLVLGGNAKFHSRAKTIVDIIIDAADEASDTIYSTTRALRNMEISLGQVGGDSEATEFLTSTSRQLDSQAADIERQASSNRRLIHKGLNIMYIVMTLTISLTLTSSIILLATGILKRQQILRLLIVLCWILTALCWLFFGIYLFVQSFSGDACIALESFQQNPYNNSLSSILPCDQLLSARSTLDDISSGIYDLVNEVNENISSSYGNVVQICNPFSPPPSYEFLPTNCSATSIHIGDIPRVLPMLVCPGNEGDTCNGGILIPADNYNTIEAYSTSIQTLLDVYPGMERLVECQTVNDAFSQILQHHCKPLERNIHMVWASLVFLSVSMVALVLTWTSSRHHNQNERSFAGSAVRPHIDGVDELEQGTVEMAKDDFKPV